MLSVLEQIGRKSSSPTAKKTRQMTLETAFFRANHRDNTDASKHASSTPPSMTTGTSNADNSSELNDDTSKLEGDPKFAARPASSSDSFDETLLVGRYLSTPREKTSDSKRDISSGVPTLAEDEDSTSEQLLNRSVMALNEDWNVGAMPGDNLDIAGPQSQKLKAQKRVSTRLEVLQRASTALEKTKSVLGKRTRETVESSKDKAAAIYGMTSSRLRSRDPRPQTPASQGPVLKKARHMETPKPDMSPKPTTERTKAKKPTKTWIDHGLYVGQTRDFNPKLTGAQNKKKHPTNTLDREPFMPLPMYSGQKALEQGRNFRLPFDVFSPLPPGQPKPDEWKKVQKNVFIGDATNVWKKAKKLEDSVCGCKPETGCDEQCYNRFMLYECDDDNCNLGRDHCTNRSFADLKDRLKAGGKYNVGVEVLKTVDRGYGIRANRSFAPNQIIVEYTGEIITKEECESRMHGRYKDAECYYLMDFDQSMILDATRGSIARFVNHSCSPNCRMAKWTVHGKPRMALFAGDNGIMTGEELTYDYNFNPFSVKNIQECRCGADNCRGVLGPKPKEAKEREIREGKETREVPKPIAGGKKRKAQQIADDAIEKVKDVVKRAKFNVPVPTSIKNAMMQAQIGIGDRSTSKPKINTTPVLSTMPKPTPKPQVKEKQKPKSVKPKLPIGWVYTAELEEAPPPVVRNIFATDPEALLRSQKRKTKQKSKEPSTSTDQGSLGNSAKKEPKIRHREPQSSPSSMPISQGSAKRNVVRTMKGRSNARAHGTPGGKSIRVIDEDNKK